MSSILELVEILPKNIRGQGIAWDRSETGVLYGIIRATKEEKEKGMTKVDPVVKTKNHCIFNSSEKEFRLFNGNLSGFSTGVDIPGCPVVQ